MLFSSIPFLYFYLPIIILLYVLVPAKLKNMVLLLGSLFFYAWGEGTLTLMLMGTIFFGWIMGLLIEGYRGRTMGKISFVFAILANLGLLGYFKYVDFFIANVNRIFGMSIPLLRIALPIGVSFYTFQLISYFADVYRGQVKAQKNLISFATYVSLFPQLIAGPIVRYADVDRQLTKRTHSLEKISDGTARFIIGLGKKVFIANSCGQLCTIFKGTTDSSVLFSWLYAIAFMLQIYYDFSGYSDMAIGLGKIFGFAFLENFNYPYISSSITEFWRRWHMSLGSWFRDYVYIPLGGNRKGNLRQLFNIFIVWMLTGLWHGASWNFVMWGLYYAILLMIEKLGLLSCLKKHVWIGHIYTVIAVMMGFVMFDADSIKQAGQTLASMWGMASLPLLSVQAVYYFKSYVWILLFGIIGVTPLVKQTANRVVAKLPLFRPLALTGILLLVTAYLVDGTFNPFLYFRF